MGGTLCPQSAFQEADTSGNDTFAVKDEKMMARLNDVEAFEFKVPFYTCRIDKFEGNVKRFVNFEDKNTVTMKQLIYAFKEDTPWNSLSD